MGITLKFLRTSISPIIPTHSGKIHGDLPWACKPHQTLPMPPVSGLQQLYKRLLPPPELPVLSRASCLPPPELSNPSRASDSTRAFDRLQSFLPLPELTYHCLQTLSPPPELAISFHATAPADLPVCMLACPLNL